MADFRAIIARAKRQADKTSGYSGYSGYALEKVNQNSDLAHTRRVTSDDSAPITAVTALQPSDQRITTVTTERGSVVTGNIEINQHLTVDVTAVTNVTNKNREEANFEIGEDAKRTLAFAPGRIPGTRPVVDEAEREAIAIELGGVPEIYAKAFAAIQAHPPADIPQNRWERFIDDAGRFLDQWGAEAERLGWAPEELFGLDPIAPMARYDRMGLIWMLHGETVLELTAEGARLAGGLAFYRRPAQ